ncbi:carboxymuconolactone decarboxylase family protein [Mycolicibacterium boenickei]|nr:carboxymuconolactone decarboxylase family protein [Mycolicibacterium boenickei]
MTSHDKKTALERRNAGAKIVVDMLGADFSNMMAGSADRDDAASMLGRLALEQCYGDVWTRPELSRRDRSLVTLGILMSAGHRDEIANHVRGALANGVTVTELTEIALHSAPYIGLPAAGHAMSTVTETCAAYATTATPTATGVLHALFGTGGDHHQDSSPATGVWHEDATFFSMGADGIDRELHGLAEIAGLADATKAVMDEMVDALIAVHPMGDDMAVATVRAHRRVAESGDTIDSVYALVVQVSEGKIAYARDLPSAAYREFFRRAAALR